MNVKFHKNCETGEILKISCATCHLTCQRVIHNELLFKNIFPKMSTLCIKMYTKKSSHYLYNSWCYTVVTFTSVSLEVSRPLLSQMTSP